MAVSAADVKKLRELTGAGMMDCKKALEEAEGEFGADSAAPLESGDAPAGFDIKGNKTSKKFHAPSSPWYDRTNAEVWFRTAADAESAGFVNAEAKADDKVEDKA